MNNQDCGCNEQPTPNCGCSKKLDLLCTFYGGELLLPLNIENGTDGNTVIKIINDYIKEVLVNIELEATVIESIGNGAILYKGVSSELKHQIKSMLEGSGVKITEQDKTVTISIDPQWINDNILITNVGTGAKIWKDRTGVTNNLRTQKGSESIDVNETADEITYSIKEDWITENIDYPVIDGKSVGNGFSIYAGLSNKKIQQKSLKEGSGIKISATDSEILIEAVQPGFGYIKNYYVNSNYTPTVDSPADGSIIRPFPTFDEAYDEIIGTGTYYNPQNKNAKIIIQTDSYTAINPSINKTTYHFENNKSITYTGVDDYMFDTERIYPNLLDVNNKLTEEVIMVITGVGTITRTLGVGLVRGVASNRTGTETISDFTSKIVIAPNETDFITLIERNSYPSNTWAGDITNMSNVPLSQIYGGEFKYSTTLVPTLPLIHCEGIGKAAFSWGVTSGAGTVTCIVLVNTALKIVENPLSPGVIYNGARFIIGTDGRYLATTSGTKVSGKSYYEPKSGTSYIDAEGNLRVDKIEMFANDNFSHGSVDKGFVFRGNASFVKGNMNFSGGVYFKTFVDYTNSNLNYFAFANTSEGANITLVNIGLLINLANNNPFTFIIPNTLFQYSPTSIVTNPSTPITLETYGTHASFINTPAISGIKSFEDDETAKANNLFKNNLYYNTTSGLLQFVN